MFNFNLKNYMEKFELKARTIIVTPEMAEEWLKKSESFKNRPLNNRHVEAYCKDMMEGKWELNGVAIILNKDGVVIDGQHRLHAIVRVGIPQYMFVVEGVDERCVHTIDCGMKRSLKQALAMNGVDDELSAVIQALARLRNKDRNDKNGHINTKSTTVRLESEIMDNLDRFTEAKMYGKEMEKKSAKILKKTDVSSIYLYLKEIGYSDAYVKEFFNNLATAPRNGNSIYTTTMYELTNKTYEHKKGGYKVDSYIKCFNAMTHGCEAQRRDYSKWFLPPKNKSKVNAPQPELKFTDLADDPIYSEIVAATESM